MKSRPNKQAGILQLLFSIVILVVILSVMKVDIKSLFTAEITQQNFAYVMGLLHEAWNYLVGLFRAIIWEPLTGLFGL